jgi:hypothetical protein
MPNSRGGPTPPNLFCPKRKHITLSAHACQQFLKPNFANPTSGMVQKISVLGKTLAGLIHP